MFGEPGRDCNGKECGICLPRDMVQPLLWSLPILEISLTAFPQRLVQQFVSPDHRSRVIFAEFEIDRHSRAACRVADQSNAARWIRYLLGMIVQRVCPAVVAKEERLEIVAPQTVSDRTSNTHCRLARVSQNIFDVTADWRGSAAVKIKKII